MLKKKVKKLFGINEDLIDAKTLETGFTLFNSLPFEIILIIFSFLDVKSLGRAGRVNLNFNEFANYPHLWRSLLENNHSKVGLVVIPKLLLSNKKANNNTVLKKKQQLQQQQKEGEGSPNMNVETKEGEVLEMETFTFALPDLPDLDEMDPANYKAYVKKTVNTVNENTSATEYENWNFKEVCRWCVNYNSIAEAMKHIPSDSKCRLLVREGTYKENIKVEFPVEIIGVGRADKIIIENKNIMNLLSIDTKDSKNPKAFTVIKNLTLSVTKPAVEGKVSPFFTVVLRSGDILIEDCIITSEHCSTICVQHHKGLAIIRGNNISGVGAGVSVFKCRPDMTIDTNDIHDTGCACIEIRPGTNPLIVRNKIYDSKSAGIFVFHNSTTTSPNYIQGTIMRNEIYQNSLAGIDISQGGRPLIRHNTIHHGKGIGILIHDAGRGVIEKNEIHHNSKCNIYIQQSGNPIIRKNKIHSSSIGFSASGEGATGELVGNWIFNHENEGVGILNSANPQVISNKIYSNKQAGIVVTQDGKGTYEKNEIYKNLGGGFNVSQRDTPVMKDNVLDENESVPEDMKRCVANGECTFMCTGYTFRQQSWYYCDTCAPSKDLGCCESCAKTCHAGHKLSERKYSQFFCDCGAEWNCKLVKGDKRKILPSSSSSLSPSSSLSSPSSSSISPSSSSVSPSSSSISKTLSSSSPNAEIAAN